MEHKKTYKGILISIGSPVRRFMSSSRRSKGGQTSLIMVLILAVALTFYAISLNWNKVSNLKTSTWMAAITASSQGASMLASYGERVLKEQLEPVGGLSYNGGNLKHCKRTWFLVQLLFVIIAAVLAGITAGAASFLLVFAITFALGATALIIQYEVILPMQLNMWNKLQQNVAPIDQFREAVITTGLQQIVTDNRQIPDRFDMNANGKWGFSAGRSNDMMSRYGLFYTERLKIIKPPDNSANEAFRQSLNNLITQPPPAAQAAGAVSDPGLGFSAYCDATMSSQILCNSQCTGVSQRSTSRGAQYYVPGECLPPSAPACTDAHNCPPFVGNNYPLLYDAAWERAPTGDISDRSNSFRARLGHDDEIGKSLNSNALIRPDGTLNPQMPITGSPQPSYERNSPRVKGVVYPMLQRMDEIRTIPRPSLNMGLSAAGAGILSSRFMDSVAALDNYASTDNDCAEQRDSAQGIFWKKGSDKYCSGVEASSSYAEDYADMVDRGVNFSPNGPGAAPNFHFPYDECEYMYDSSGNQLVCSAASGNLWPQDRVDNLVTQLTLMINFNKTLQDLSADALNKTLPQWYHQAASFVAPQCTPQACQTYYQTCREDCEGDAACITECDTTCNGSSYSDPIGQFVKSGYIDGGAAYGDKLVGTAENPGYAYKPEICNPDEQGQMIQWLYDLNNWKKQLEIWRSRSFGQSGDICSGDINSIVPCLGPQGFSSYLNETAQCVVPELPPPTPPPAGSPPGTLPIQEYPILNQACVTILYYGSDLTKFLYSSPVSIALTGTPPALPTSFQTDAGNYQPIKDWVNDHKILKPAINRRYGVLNQLNISSQNAYDLFQEGTANFKSFLSEGGPADTLMDSFNRRATSIKRLPSFAIYGWKDKRTYSTASGAQTGLWHLARVEVSQPKKLPRVRSYKKGKPWNRKICYELTDGQGDVWVRTTRWDEDFEGGIARFANGLPVWQFKSGNPAAVGSSATASEMVANCVKDGLGLGLTQDTIDALNTSSPSNPGLEAGSLEAQDYAGAFMINLDPRITVPNDQPALGDCTMDINDCGQPNDYMTCCTNYYSTHPGQYGYYGTHWPAYCSKTNAARCDQNRKNAELREIVRLYGPCFATVNGLLNKGVQTSMGARFGVPNQRPWHEGVFFRSASETKTKTVNIFKDTTYNDVPTEVN